MKNNLTIVLAISTLVIGILACGSSSNAPVSVSTSAPQPVEPADPEPEPPPAPALQTYDVGDLIQLNDQTIVLKGFEITPDGWLKANFTIENTSAASLNVSSILSFSSKDNEGSKLEIEIFGCGSSSLDGEILPTDKLKGDICWKTTGYPPYKIYYEANLFGTGAVVWQIQ